MKTYQKDLVSILIPVYNREKLIEETVESALTQTYTNIEIIIVDNKSTDNTWGILKELVSKDERIKIFQNEMNIGPVKNWKRCIDEATGEFGKILWSDDLIAPEFIEKTLPYLRNNDVGFVFTKAEIFYENDNKKIEHANIGKTGLYDKDKFIESTILEKRYPVSPGCAIFRLIDLKQNLLINIPNKINSDFSIHAIGNDLLLYLLTLNNYNKFYYLNETLSYFRAHIGSISVSTSSSKLKLFYLLATSYFIERNAKKYIKKLNNTLNDFLNNNQKICNSFGVIHLEDFYLINKDLHITDYQTKKSKKLNFSKNYNKFYDFINSISDNLILYGYGTIGKTILKLIPDKIIGYVDINDKNNHPRNLGKIKFDKILITVLGRENEIIDYLVNELKIDENKILTIEI